MRSVSLLMLFTLVISVYSCGGDSGGGDGSDLPAQETADGSSSLNLIYDSELQQTERNALDTSTAKLVSLDIDGSQIRGFSKVFGGNESSDVVEYFERRVKYALSDTTDVISRIESDPVEPIPPGEATPEILAINLGAGLWLASAVLDAGTVNFSINNEVIPVESTRVGIIQFGDVFTQIEPLRQVNTLVHEARHSDCTGGLSAEALQSLRAEEIPEDKSCGHSHALCPPGHPFAELPACDSEPWGAYAIGAFHSVAVSETCSNCSETEKTIAEQEALDSLSRLLYNPEDLIEGRLGEPNMSSSNEIKE